MPFLSGEKGHGFEKRVEHEFSLLELPEYKDKKTVPVTCKNYICKQPFGSQKAPDFIVCINGEELYVEAKRSSKDKPMWNSGVAQQETVYIFNGGTKGCEGTTIVMGFDLLSEKEALFWERFKEELRLLKESKTEEYKIMFPNPVVSMKLQHIRPMFDIETKLLSDPLRNQRESVAIDFISKNFQGKLND